MARDRQTSLRLEGALLEKLQKAARDNRRTLAAEISLRLEQSFEPTRPDEVLREISLASRVLAQLGERLSTGDRYVPPPIGPSPYPETGQPINEAKLVAELEALIDRVEARSKKEKVKS